MRSTRSSVLCSFLKSLDEATQKLQRSMKLLEKEFERSQSIPSSQIQNVYKHQGAKSASFKNATEFSVSRFMTSVASLSFTDIYLIKSIYSHFENGLLTEETDQSTYRSHRSVKAFVTTLRYSGYREVNCFLIEVH